MNIAELFVSLGVKADTQGLKRVDTLIKGISSSLKATAVAFTAALYGLDKFTQGTIKSVFAMQDLQAQTGLSIEKLQKWQQAGSLINPVLTPEKISSSIASFQKNLSAIRMGEGNIAPFQMLGIETGGKDAFQVLNDLREAVKGVDAGMASNWIEQMGLDPSFLMVLRASREEFDKLSHNAFLSKGQRQNVAQLGFAIQQLKSRLSALKDQAVAKLAPSLTALANGFFKYMQQNGKQIIDTISGLATAVGNFVTMISRGSGLLGDWVKDVAKLEGGLVALKAVALGLVAVFSPFLAMLYATFLLLEDLYVWKKGGKSLFGEVFGEKSPEQDMKNRAEMAHGERNNNAVKNYVSNVWMEIKALGSPQENAMAVKNALDRKSTKYQSAPL